MYQEAMEKSLFNREKSAFKAEIEYTEKKPAGYEIRCDSVTQKCLFLHDRDRMDICSENTAFKDGSITEERKSQYLLGKEYGYQISHKIGEPTKNIWAFKKDRVTNAIGCIGTNAYLEGYSPGDSMLSFWEILKETKDLTLRNEMETIDGHRTYVLEAKTRSLGEYSLWIDPNCDFNVRRLMIRKTGKDLMGNKPLNSPPLKGGNPAAGPQMHFPTIECIITLDAVKIDKIENIFVPVGGTLDIVTTYSNGEQIFAHDICKRYEIDLNPDFNKFENAFVLDAPNGTTVEYADLLHTGVRYIWQDGKIIPIDIQP